MDEDTILTKCLEGLYGANAEQAARVNQEYTTEQHELIERHRRATQELINEALDKLTFFGGDRLAFFNEAHQITHARREALDQELHEALVDALERFQRRVNALIPPKDCE